MKVSECIIDECARIADEYSITETKKINKRKPVKPVTILPTPKAMDVFEQQEMTKSTGVEKQDAEMV